MSERQFACLSLAVISTAANHLAVSCVDGWGDYWYGVAKAATLTSYVLQILLEVIHLLRLRHPCYPDGHEVGV